MNDTQVDHSLCMAHGCNMIASMSLSTKGDDWCCFIHVKAERDDWQAITAELNRLGWLVEAVKCIRANAPEKKMVEVRRNIGLAQRSDLLRKESESAQQWYVRLENVLAESCARAILKEGQL